MNKGKFIVVEGISGSGKGVQMNELKKKFPDFFFDHEPSSEFYGKLARLISEKQSVPADLVNDCFHIGDPQKYEFWHAVQDILKKVKTGELLGELEIQFLIIADRIYNLENKYLPNFENGRTVIIDRYFLSLLAYGFSGGLDMDILWDWQLRVFRSSEVILNKWKPDLAIIIDLEARTATERLKFSGKIIDMFEEKFERMEKIREGYLKIAQNKDIAEKIVVIDGNRSVAEVFESIKKEIDKLFVA